MGAKKAYFAFTNSNQHWISIKEEVRGWVEANWSTGKEEKPKWLTETFEQEYPWNGSPQQRIGRRR